MVAAPHPLDVPTSKQPKHVEKTFPSSIKLPKPLQARVEKAMEVEGSEVFAEFARTALTEKCRRIETELLKTNPKEYERIYGHKA